jgi:hypothetical protein
LSPNSPQQFGFFVVEMIDDYDLGVFTVSDVLMSWAACACFSRLVCACPNLIFGRLVLPCLQSWLALLIMVLVVVYHYVSVEQQQQQQQQRLL